MSVNDAGNSGRVPKTGKSAGPPSPFSQRRQAGSRSHFTEFRTPTRGSGRAFGSPAKRLRNGVSGRNDGRKSDFFGQPERTGPSRQMATGTLCRFCRRAIKYVDYKDVETLQKLLTNRGKIYSRKRSGNCAGCQRKVKKAIKRARYMALLPFAK